MNVTVVYVYPVNAVEYHDWALRFLDSYHRFPPGFAHSTVVVLNDGKVTPEIQCLFASLPGLVFLERDNSGYDIGAFIAAAKQYTADLIVCFGSHAYFWRQDWLARMVQARLKHGPGVYGANTSFQEMPHLNTTAFWCDPGLLASYPWPVVSKQGRYSFEQDKRRPDRPFWVFVYSLGKPALFVTWDGEYEWWDWRKPPNIFRRGDQSNMLVNWKWSDHWRDASPDIKLEVSRITDTLTLNPFDPRTFPKTPA